MFNELLRLENLYTHLTIFNTISYISKILLDEEI